MKTGYVEKAGTGFRAYLSKGIGWGIYIPAKIIHELLEKGQHNEKHEIDGCPFEEIWTLR